MCSGLYGYKPKVASKSIKLPRQARNGICTYYKHIINALEYCGVIVKRIIIYIID
jgi:hypothetical protein